MHRHRIRAFVSGVGETDVPVAIFANGQFLRFISPSGGIITSSLGPGTTTINALATWGDTTGTSLLNTTTLLDASGNMTQLVTLDGQDAPNITAKIGADPTLQEITVWASTTAPWKLGRSGAKINTTGDMTDVNTLNGRSPGILVGRSPTSAPSTNSVMVSADGTGIVARGTPVLIDSAGNMTGVTSINGTTPGDWVQGPASSTDNTLATWNGTTGRFLKSATVITAAGSQLREMTFFNSIGVSEHGLGGNTPTSVLSSVNDMSLGYTTISNVTALDGVDPLTWVVGPSSVTANRVATFNGTTGKLIQQSSVAISSGAVTGVTSINAIDPSTWVVGPASATSTRIAIFNGSTGKLIQQSSITASGGDLASVDTINGRNPTLWVEGPASATSNGIPRFTSANIVANSTATVDASGNMVVTTLNTVNPSTWVVGPSSAVTGTIAVFSGTSGKVIADSGYTTAFIQRGTGAIIGPLSITSGGLTGSGGFVPGYGFNKRSSSYHAAFEANIPVTFPDTSVTLTFTVSSDDNVGQWQIHTPNSSATLALGSSGTFVNGTPTAFANASFKISVGLTVPSGSGTHSLNIGISSSGTAASLEAYGTQFWFEASKL